MLDFENLLSVRVNEIKDELKIISDVQTWMVFIKLHINEGKIEVPLVTAKGVLNLHHLPEFMNINGIKLW